MTLLLPSFTSNSSHGLSTRRGYPDRATGTEHRQDGANNQQRAYHYESQGKAPRTRHHVAGHDRSQQAKEIADGSDKACGGANIVFRAHQVINQ
ncbi:hypothetical protein D3C76_1440110 [compost metagenome]